MLGLARSRGDCPSCQNTLFCSAPNLNLNAIETVCSSTGRYSAGAQRAERRQHSFEAFLLVALLGRLQKTPKLTAVFLTGFRSSIGQQISPKENSATELQARRNMDSDISVARRPVITVLVLVHSLLSALCYVRNVNVRCNVRIMHGCNVRCRGGERRGERGRAWAAPPQEAAVRASRGSCPLSCVLRQVISKQ